MNIEIEMSGFDAVLNEAMKIVAPETLEAANRESGEYLRDYLASWYDNKGREHWVNNSLPTHGPGRMSTGWFSNIARKWFLSSADASGAPVSNGFFAIKFQVKERIMNQFRRLSRFITEPHPEGPANLSKAPCTFPNQRGGRPPPSH